MKPRRNKGKQEEDKECLRRKETSKKKRKGRENRKWKQE